MAERWGKEMESWLSTAVKLILIYCLNKVLCGTALVGVHIYKVPSRYEGHNLMCILVYRLTYVLQSLIVRNLFCKDPSSPP